MWTSETAVNAKLDFRDRRHGEVRRRSFPRTPVNKDKRKRLRYILSTQLLPKHIQRQELGRKDIAKALPLVLIHPSAWKVIS
jgi:hypothetical protein